MSASEVTSSKSDLITLLQRIKGWRLWLLVAIGAVLGAELIVSAMDLLLKGEITTDYLLTGLVASGIIAPPSLALLSYFLGALSKRQQEFLANSARYAESRLIVALEASRLVWWELDLINDELRYDDAMLPLLGMDAGDAPHSLPSWLERVHPDDRAELRERLQASLGANDPIFDFEYRIEQTAGQWGWLQTHGRVIQRDQAGRAKLAVGTTKNITERKQSEITLAESRRLLQTIIDTAPLRVFWKDRNLCYRGCNPAFAKDAGKTHTKEVIGNDDYQMAWADLAERYRADDRSVMESGVSKLGYDEPQTTPDGRTIWLRTSKVPLRNHDNETIGVLGIYEDVTEQKLLADALRQREEYQRALLDNFPFLVWLKDENSRYLAVNQPFADVCGYSSPLLLVGKSDLDLWPADLAGAYLADDCAILESGTPKNVEEQVVVDGQRVWHETYKSPVRIEGRVIGTVGFARDITQRRHAEAELDRHRHHLEELVQQRTTELMATEAKASHILQSSADGLYGVDAEGVITFINPAALALLGYRAEQVIGGSAHALFHHSKPDGAPYPVKECPSHNALRIGREIRVDSEVYWHADGHALPVMYAVHPMLHDGEITGAVISVVDISEQRAAALAREKALAAAENLARVRSEFLANMSHEIRTPLNGVLGFAQIGRRNFQNAEKARNAFEKIIASGNLLLGVVNEILDFSKIEAGKMRIDPIEMSPVEVIDHALDVVGDRARAKQLDLRVERAPDLPETCIGDPLRIGQVLINLLSNAVKFTEAGGVTLSASRDGDALVFRVADTGIGMNEEQLGQLFHPFQQADGSTTRKFGGTGLGLAISKRILELIDGDIQVESKPGVGSTFEFRVPYVRPRPPTKGATPGPVADAVMLGKPLAGLTILVAEDDAINQLVLEENLREDGARVVTVGNGREAVERVGGDGAKAYDIVLMDIQMPEMDGYEATRRIAALAPALPVIGQTAHALEEEREQCLAAGMVAHIAKPIDPEALVRLLRRYASPKHKE